MEVSKRPRRGRYAFPWNCSCSDRNRLADDPRDTERYPGRTGRGIFCHLFCVIEIVERVFRYLRWPEKPGLADPSRLE